MHISGYQTNREMTEILQSSTHDLPSSSSSTSFTFHHQHTHENHDSFPNLLCPVALYSRRDIGCQLQQQQQQQQHQVEDVCSGLRKKREREETENQPSLFDVLVTGFRKSLVACKKEVSSGMEIGCPMNVRHVAHVTFDRFNGFLGLPVEFEPEVSRRPPSASTRVFGVSTESMQLSFDTRGNSVPTILLMMQRRLYAQGALQVEGIFRINGENGEEEFVREQLNRGIVPENVDVHCLAGLIKAWFRELPTGLLDSLPPEQVLQADSEEQCVHLTRLLPPTEAALLDWAINLMADVAQLQHLNKMNSRNIATVFAPNMTQNADPLTALMFAVKVMNFLKTLIERILKGRQDSIVDIAFADHLEPSNQSGDHDALQPITHDTQEGNEEQVSEDNEELESYYETRDVFVVERENIPKRQLMACKNLVYIGSGKKETILDQQQKCIKNKNEQSSSNSGDKNASRRSVERPVVYDIYVAENTEKGQDSSVISRVNWRTQRLEAWR